MVISLSFDCSFSFEFIDILWKEVFVMISMLIKLFRFLGSSCYTVANGLKLLKR